MVVFVQEGEGEGEGEGASAEDEEDEDPFQSSSSEEDEVHTQRHSIHKRARARDTHIKNTKEDTLAHLARTQPPPCPVFSESPFPLLLYVLC